MDLAIKFNNTCSTVDCYNCGERFEPEVGYQVTLRDDFHILCDDCVEENAPELLKAVRVANGVLLDGPPQERGERRELLNRTVYASLHENKLVAYFEVVEEDTTTPDEVLFFGHIKWDGCSNWHFPNGNYQLHFCGKDRAKEFGDLLAKMYEWAVELMPDHKEYLED